MNRRSLLLSPLALAVVGADARKKRRRPSLAADAILGPIAAQQIHGDANDLASPEALLAILDATGHIETRCGTVARLGVFLLEQSGIPARFVGCITREDWDGRNDGHAMLEAREHGAWTLYDIDGNRRLPAGKGIVDACNGHRDWKSLAHDDPCVTECDILTNLPVFDARVFGVPAIMSGGVYCFHDDAMRSQIEALGYRYVGEDAWRRLR